MQRLLLFISFSILISFPSISQSACCTTKDNSKECHSKASISDELSEMSLYNLSSNWVTSEGKEIKLARLKGKIQIITMVYTSCQYACPRIMADLKIIEKSIKKYSTEKVGIVLVTMDPERDTPERLKAFAQENKLDKKRWTLLTGESSDIMELAALLNVKYKKETTGDISHSNIITVLNTEGEIAKQQEGLGTNPEPSISAIQKLLLKAELK